MIFYIILAILIINYLGSQLLDYLNMKTWESHLPPELHEYYDEAEYQKARQYNKEKEKFSFVTSTFNFLLILIFFISGGFGWLNDVLEKFFSNPIPLALAYFGVLFFATDLLNLPFSVYNTFVIEEKFGFNKTKPKTFILDKIKGYLLAIIIGGILLSLILWFILFTGRMFWVYAFIVIAVFILFINLFYTSLIIPLFNKLTPLGEGDLKQSIKNYAAKVNFPLKQVFIIDGSKKSTKANAFFSGLGKTKKVVLYDTLIENHTKDELLSILAHEVGHYKKNHIPVNIFISVGQIALMLFLLSLFVFNKNLSLAMGASDWELHINLIAFSLLYEPISLLLGIGMNYLSRKFEFQADRFASETADGEALISGLKKLSVKHLANLKPHPAYIFFYYSHPPLLKRIKSIRTR